MVSQCHCTENYFKDIFEKTNNTFVSNPLPDAGSRHKPYIWSKTNTLQTQKPRISRSFSFVYNETLRRSVIDYF